ncbi:MAG: signal peptide peptidase SppA [Planctomycetaceae bacterium]|nr:signal peptide peptidase SppA [Planctomycetaceae bacterium]
MAENSTSVQGPPITVVIQYSKRRWLILFLIGVLAFSVLLNFGLMAMLGDYLAVDEGPYQTFHSGEIDSENKIARLAADFTIMPPYSGRLMDSIQAAREDDEILGALLVVDSPGGLVSDSHEIFHELKRLSESKPVIVSFKGMAASGGYYIAMGAGPDAAIFAEPITWTGSIGVIIPRYNASGLAQKVGVEPEALKTGPLKDTLNMFKDLSDEEIKVWDEILEDSFDRFLTVIDENRSNLTKDQVRDLATGQVYTANQALANGLVDQIGFEEDALAALKEKLAITDAMVVQYEHPVSLAESLLGVKTSVPEIHVDPLSKLLSTGVPRAMYLFGWQHGLTTSGF